MASGVRDLSLVVTSRLGVIPIGICTQACLAWFLGPSGRGSLAVCFIYSSILSVVFMFGLDMAGHYHIASRKLSQSQVATIVVGLGILCGFGGAAVGFLGTYLPIPFFSKASHSSFLLCLVLIPSQILNMHLQKIITALRDFHFFAFVHLMQSLVVLICTVIFVKLLRGGVNGAITAIIFGGYMVVLLTIFRLISRHNTRLVRPSWRAIVELFSYGSRYSIGSISNAVGTRIGPVLLAFFASRSEIGMFAMASVLTGRIGMISDSITTVIQPRLAGHPTGRPELAAQCARWIQVVVTPVLLCIGVFAGPIIRALFSEAFLPAVPLVRIFVLGHFLYLPCKAFGPYLNGTNHPGLLSLSTFARMAVTLIGIASLFPLLGLAGAAWGVSIGNIAAGTVLAAAFWKLSSLSFRRTWRPRRDDLTPLVHLWNAFARKMVRHRVDDEKQRADKIQDADHETRQ